MNEDRVIGNAKNVGGRVEEGFGRAAGDVKSQVQGKAKQAEGAVAARWPLRRTTLAEDPGSTRPERHFPSGAAQTRVVSAARIRLDPRKSVRSYKGIIYGDISEFESYMPRQAVRSLGASSGLQKYGYEEQQLVVCTRGDKQLELRLALLVPRHCSRTLVLCSDREQKSKLCRRGFV